MIICDNCKAEVSTEQLKKKFGEVEITYLECKECSSEYVITVTDEELRCNIEKAANQEKILRNMAIDQKNKIDLLKKEYGLKIKATNRVKIKRSLEKEFKQKVSKLAKDYKSIYELELDKYEQLKKANIERNNELKKMYE